MANIVHQDALSIALALISDNVDTIHIVSADPTDYADCLAKSLGSKAFAVGAAFTDPAAGTPNGRAIASTQITDGAVTVTGTATGWAVVDTAGTRLMANGDLAAPQAVVSGNTFQLPSFGIRLPNQ